VEGVSRAIRDPHAAHRPTPNPLPPTLLTKSHGSAQNRHRANHPHSDVGLVFRDQLTLFLSI